MGGIAYMGDIKGSGTVHARDGWDVADGMAYVTDTKFRRWLGIHAAEINVLRMVLRTWRN